MIDIAKLDAAVLSIATVMDTTAPMTLLRHWLSYFPTAVYPFIVAEYRYRTGAPSFVVLTDHGFSDEARRLMRQIKT